jgi:hypothetical protein
VSRMIIAVGILMVGLAACPAAPPAIDDPDAVTVSAAVVEPDATVFVEVSDVEDVDGELRHSVLVTWEGDEPVVLEDARFTHRVPTEDGALLLAGRGCSWSWFDEAEDLAGICTDDLQIIQVESGGTHPYPVAIHVEEGPVRLVPGVYEVEEEIAWSRVEDPDFPDAPAAEPDGTFTIRLVYDVRG